MRKSLPELGTAVEKQCSGCGLVKSVFAFGLSSSRKDGLASICRKCQSKADLVKLSKPEKREKHNKQVNDRYHNNEYVRVNDREIKLKLSYGITIEEYNAMLLSQNGVCIVCEEPESRLSKSGEVICLAVHHSHKTGKVIALCCANCNAGMGNLNDDPDLMFKAAELNE